MKWLAIAGVLLYLCRHSDAGALKCSPESQEPRCTTNRDISPVQSLIEPEKERESSPDTECLAGSEWESNCHYCRCSDSGVAECLKADACDFPVFVEPIKCKPNTTFERDCNTCTCLENGLGLCTLRTCLLAERRKREAKCEPGSSWKEHCNTCWCLENGSAACTNKACLHNPTSSSLEKRDTSKSKSSIKRTSRAVQEAPKTCQPGQEFRMDCNKCLCNDEGQDFSCTRIDCTAQNNNGGVDSFTSARAKRETTEIQTENECAPGSVFDRECNVCRCTEDGRHATCTLKRCNLTVEAETEPAPSFRCTPGDQFKRECNDCTCSADGKTVFCTLRLCDQILAGI